MKPITCVGLMSGTSVDGIDVAIVSISGEPPTLAVKVRYFETVPFSEAVREKIFCLFDTNRTTAADVSQMNFLLGHVFADAVLQAVGNSDVDITNIMFIASHGQTIYHHPVPQALCGYDVTSTMQIGEASVIAEKTGIPTISDFRVRDMAAGGQGAPLVPFVDSLLFSHPSQGRIAANIGGIANLTVLPVGAGAAGIVAFDTGPGNMIVDGLVQRMTEGGQRYDVDGAIARRGQVQENYLHSWLSLPYFAQQPPKSTGRELFGAQMVSEWWEDGERLGIKPEDLVATATEYTVRTFAGAIREFVLPRHAISEVLIGGGGAYNPVMMEGIQRLLPELRVVSQAETGISSDAKEAVAFAVLGYECYHRRPNNLPSATGASKPVVLGKIVWS